MDQRHDKSHMQESESMIEDRPPETNNSGRNLQRAILIVFCVGLAGVAAGTAGIRTAQDISWIRFFDNLHWTAGTAAAAVLCWIGLRSERATGHSGMIFYSAVGLTGYAFGQIAWDIQTILAYSKFPTPSDLLYLWLGPGLCIGLLREIHERVRREDRMAVRLDIIAFFIATLTLVLDLYLPKRGDLDLLQLSVLVAYPLTLLLAFCIGLVMIPALRLRNTLNLWIFILSVGVTAWSWMTWNLMALEGTTADGAWFNISFSIAVLMMGMSLSRWSPETSSNKSWIKACEDILRMLPLVNVILASAAVIVALFHPGLPTLVSKATIIGSFAVIVLAILRQMLLLRERDLSEKALKESEERYRMIVSTANEGIWMLGPESETVFVNAKMSDMVQMLPEEIIGRHFADFVFRDEMEDHIIRMKHRREGVSEVYERRLVRRDGGTVWTQVSATPVFDEEHRFMGSFGMFADITRLKMKEIELRRSEEALRIRESLMNESQRVGQVGGWDWDAVNDIIWWSDEYYRIFGFESGTPPPNYKEHLNAYTPESAARLDTALKHSMETGEHVELDLELATPTPETRWIVARCEVKRDESGRICGLRGTAQNITERKLAEEDLKRLSLRTEMILNSAGEGIYGTDDNGNITFINAAALSMFGYESHEVIGKSSHWIFHHTKLDGSAYPLEECPLYKALKQGKAYRGVDEVFYGKGGRAFPVEHINTPIIYLGKVMGAVVVFRDITERKRAEEEIRSLYESLERRVSERTVDLRQKGDELRGSQIALMNIVEDLNDKTSELEQANKKLQELDRLKSMFIVSMSHELRTPLNSIIGFSSIMLNEWTGHITDEQKENLSSILRSGKHLLSLINDVIDVSKIEAGKIESFNDEFDLFDLMTEAVQSLSQDAARKGLPVELRAVHKLMYGDRRRLLQCLLNLLSNAIKFTENGKVALSSSSRDEGRFVELSVADTGIGISENDQSRLFMPFVRFETGMKSTAPGTGLGLYLTRKLVKDVLKGDILFSSVPGKGSIFTLLVPTNASGRQ